MRHATALHPSKFAFSTPRIVFSATVGRLGLWYDRYCERRHLAELPEEMLKDIGITAAAARKEASKPFWVA